MKYLLLLFLTVISLVSASTTESAKQSGESEGASVTWTSMLFWTLVLAGARSRELDINAGRFGRWFGLLIFDEDSRHNRDKVTKKSLQEVWH